MTYAIGDTVRSKPVGSKDSFVGTVAGIFDNYKNATCYTVRDGFNKRWFREEVELEAVN